MNTVRHGALRRASLIFVTSLTTLTLFDTVENLFTKFRPNVKQSQQAYILMKILHIHTYLNQESASKFEACEIPDSRTRQRVQLRRRRRWDRGKSESRRTPQDSPGLPQDATIHDLL